MILTWLCGQRRIYVILRIHVKVNKSVEFKIYAFLFKKIIAKLKVKKEGVILKKSELAFENDSVLNPGTYQDGNTVQMLYRAVRNGNYSTIGYWRLEGSLNVVERNYIPLMISYTSDASNGIEDPRIVKIEDVYYITYTTYSGINALGALATSLDLITFERKGIIVPKFTFDDFKILAECNNLVNAK